MCSAPISASWPPLACLSARPSTRRAAGVNGRLPGEPAGPVPTRSVTAATTASRVTPSPVSAVPTVDSLAAPGEADEQVLRADAPVPEGRRLVDGRCHDVAGLLGEPLERDEAAKPAVNPPNLVPRSPAAPSAGAVDGLHDLVDPLVAEPEGVGDLAERPARGVQPADGVVVVDARDLGGMLQIEEPVAGLLRLRECVLVQCHHCLFLSFSVAIVLDTPAGCQTT